MSDTLRKMVMDHYVKTLDAGAVCSTVRELVDIASKDRPELWLEEWAEGMGITPPPEPQSEAEAIEIQVLELDGFYGQLIRASIADYFRVNEKSVDVRRVELTGLESTGGFHCRIGFRITGGEYLEHWCEGELGAGEADIWLASRWPRDPHFLLDKDAQ